MSAVQSAAGGTQACNEAVATIKGIMADIEITAMFAREGALNPESEGSSFAEHRESILVTAKKSAEHVPINESSHTVASSPALLGLPSFP